MVAVVLVTIIMLIAAVVLSVFATRVGIIVVMRTVFVVVRAVLVGLLNRSRQPMRFAAGVIVVHTASQHCVYRNCCRCQDADDAVKHET